MTDGYRKAALVLSSLAGADRDWILGRLQAEEQAELRGLLQELRSLGFAPGASLVKELVLSRPAAEPAPPGVTVSAATAFAVLAREPDWLIALLLRLRPWPWRESFLRLLGTEWRMRVQESLPAAEARPKVVQALLAALERRLQAQAAFTSEEEEWHA
jgi:hypothetical protein